MIAVIDTDGALGIYKPATPGYISLLVALALDIGFSLIMYSHFQAHYLTLHKTLPKFLSGIVFGCVIACEQVAGFIGHAIVYQYNDDYYGFIGAIGSAFFLIGFMAIDLSGYYLIRKVLLDVMVRLESMKQSPSNEELGSLNPPEELTESQRPLSHSTSSGGGVDQSPYHTNVNKKNNNTTNHPVPASSPENEPVVINYHDFLIRMRRFHIILSIVCIFLFILVLSNLIGLKHGPPVLPNPEVYTFTANSVIPFLYIFLWCVLTWWAWIPFRYVSGTQSQNSKTTKMSIHRDHRDHDHDPEQKTHSIQSKEASSTTTPPELLTPFKADGRGDSPLYGEEPFPLIKEDEIHDKEYSPPTNVLVVKITGTGELIPQN